MSRTQDLCKALGRINEFILILFVAQRFVENHEIVINTFFRRESCKHSALHGFSSAPR